MDDDEKLLQEELEKLQEQDIQDDEIDIEELLHENQVIALESIENELPPLQKMDSWKELVKETERKDDQDTDLVLAESISKKMEKEYSFMEPLEQKLPIETIPLMVETNEEPIPVPTILTKEESIKSIPSWNADLQNSLGSRGSNPMMARSSTPQRAVVEKEPDSEWIIESRETKQKGQIIKGQTAQLQKQVAATEKTFASKLKLLGIRMRVDLNVDLKKPVLKRGFSFSDVNDATGTNDKEKEETDEEKEELDRVPSMEASRLLGPQAQPRQGFGFFDRKRSVSTNKLPLFESKKLYENKKREWDTPNAVLDLEEDSNQETFLDAKVLGAITRKLNLELQVLNDRKKRQKEFHNNINFQLESFKIDKKARTRHIRESRAQIPILQEKKKQILHFIEDDFKSAFAKEKTRNGVLLAAASNFKNKLSKIIQDRGEVLEDIHHVKEEAVQQSKYLKSKFGEVKMTYNKLKDDIRFMKSEYDKFLDEVTLKRNFKMSMVQKNVMFDSEVQIKDIEVLMKALNKRKTMGFQIASIKELDVIDLTDCSLNRLPLMQLNTEVVKHVNISKNQITNLDSLDMFGALESLVTDNNALEEINLKELQNLKALSIASNHLTTLNGLCKRLHYLNASANRFTDLSGIDNAPDLRILILTNSAVRDLSYLKYLKKLLYLDMSSSNLNESILEQLFQCSLLQYINGSSNLFRTMPDILNIALNELHLNSNMIVQLTRTQWLFNLRVLHMTDNRLVDIEPLAMCPFLKELNLSHNSIKEIKYLYSISVCQTLEKLDLTGNPIVEDPKYTKLIGTFLPNIKEVNGQVLDFTNTETASSYRIAKPLHAIKECRIAQFFILAFVEDPSDAEYKLETFNIWEKLSKRMDKSVVESLGKYYSPFLNYICCGSELLKFDPTTNIHVQEKRLFWLSDVIQEYLKEAEILPVVTWDGSLMRFQKEVERKIDWHRAAYIQSLWRAKMNRKRYLKAREMIINIQRSFRNYKACKSFKDILRALKKQSRDNEAAIRIQKLWRGKQAREIYQAKLEVEQERKMQEQKLRDEELARQLQGLEKETKEIDQWLEETDENKFDRMMQKYLANEKLVHYPGKVKNKPKQKTKAQEMLEKGMSLEELRHEDQIASEVNSTEGSVNGDGLGQSHGHYLGDGIEPPNPPMISLQKTMQLARDRHKIMTNIARQYNNLPQLHEPTANGHVSIKTLLVNKAGDMDVAAQNDDINRIIELPESKLYTAQDLEGQHSRAGSSKFKEMKQSHHFIKYGSMRPTYIEEENERPATHYLHELKYVSRSGSEADFEESGRPGNHYGKKTSRNESRATRRFSADLHDAEYPDANLYQTKTNRKESKFSGQSPEEIDGNHYHTKSTRKASRLTGKSSEKVLEKDGNHCRTNSTRKTTGTSNSARLISDHPKFERSRQSSRIPEEVAFSKISEEMIDDEERASEFRASKYSFDKPVADVAFSREDMRPASEEYSKYVPFYTDPYDSINSIHQIETRNDFNDSTRESFIANKRDSREEERGWDQYTKKTIQMMQQRIPSNKAMTSRVKAQEQVKQVHRVATRYKVDPISRKESIESFQEVLKNKYKRSQVPVVFEWDIQPGQVSQKFLPPSSKPNSDQNPQHIPFVGNLVQSPSNNRIPQPPITLLINNYVKAQPQNLIDPSIVHRLPPPKPRPGGPLATMLDLIPSKIKVPESPLNRHQILPSIPK